MTYNNGTDTPPFAVGIRIAAVAIIMLLSACTGKDGDTVWMQRMKALDDSIAHLSPNVPMMATDGMRAASDSLEYYTYCLRLARYQIGTGHADSATVIMRRSVAFLQQQKLTPRVCSLLGYAYNCEAVAAHNFHRTPETTQRIFRQAYGMLMKSDNIQQAPDVCANLADSYALAGKLPQAASWFRRALFLVDSLQLSPDHNITLYMGLGRVYMMLEDYDMALKNYRETEKFFNHMNPDMQTYLLNSLGNYYYYTKDYPKALSEFRRMENLLTGYGMQETFSMYACKLNMADVLLNMGRITEAEERIAEAEQYFAAHTDSVATYYIHSVQLALALRRGNMGEARRLSSLDDAPENVQTGLKDIRNRYLREYYEKTGNYRAALANLKVEQQQTDSLVHNRQHMIAAEVMNRLAQDTLSLHHKIEMQHKETAVKEAHTMIIGAVATVALLILFIACGLMYVQRNRLLLKMSIFKLRMENVRNRISPHFVLNVLNNRITNATRKEADELTLLSQLIRTNLDITGKELIPLSEEMAFVDNYIEVERRILDDELEYNKHLNPAADEAFLQRFMVPPTSVQILAENSIKHALRGKKGKKQLTIGICADAEGALTITVDDNGPGFDIRVAEAKRGYGLRILHSTIQMLNRRSKRKITFAIRNTTDDEGNTTGCRATLYFPCSPKSY